MFPFLAARILLQLDAEYLLDARRRIRLLGLAARRALVRLRRPFPYHKHTAKGGGPEAQSHKRRHPAVEAHF
jgi:hypothetical protein